jgi:hypothetical protein
MPPLRVLPQKTPFDPNQIAQMNLSIQNLFNTVEKERTKNQDRHVARIISDIKPRMTDGTPKTKLELNQEIQDRVRKSNLDRQPSGVLGALFGGLSTTAPPTGLTPLEQGLTKSTFSNLLGGEHKKLSPSAQGGVLDDFVGVTNSVLSDILGKPVSITDRSKKGTGIEALDALDANAVEVYNKVYKHGKALGMSGPQLNRLLGQYAATHMSGNQKDIDTLHETLVGGQDFDTLKDDVFEPSKTIVDEFVKQREAQSGFTDKGELENLQKDKVAMDLMRLILVKTMKDASSSRLLALKENLRDKEGEGVLTFDELDFMEGLIDDPQPQFDKDGQLRENVLTSKWGGSPDDLDNIFHKLLQAGDTSLYKSKYLATLNALEKIKDKGQYRDALKFLSESKDIVTSIDKFIQ